MITVQIESFTMKLVSTGAGDDIDGATGGLARGEFEVCESELKLADYVLREAHRRAADEHRHNAPAVYRNAGVTAIKSSGRAKDRNERTVSGSANGRGNSRLKLG